jgi:hypothetical protein
VAANLTDSLKALLEGKGSVPEGISLDAKAQLEQTRQLAIQALITRSQGLQNLRDITYQACIAKLNGFITETQYAQIFRAALSGTTALIAAELVAAKVVVPGTGTSPAVKLDKEVVQEMLNFVQLMAATPD